MTIWDSERLQAQFKQHERMKQGDMDRCKVQILNGKADYKQFYDQALAEQILAFVLGTDAALADRDAMLKRLGELRSRVIQGGLDAAGIYNTETFRNSATEYIGLLISRFSDNSRGSDISSLWLPPGKA